MEELSLHLLDIAQNALRAEATEIRIVLLEREDRFSMTVSDNGVGMKPELLARADAPFFTTKKESPNAGLGLPLLKQAAERTGGAFQIQSRHRDEYPDNHGTCVAAEFVKTHAECAPVGDVIATIMTLLHGGQGVDLVFSHEMDSHRVLLDTREMRAELGEDIPISTPEVLHWIRDSLTEQYSKK